MCVTVLSGHELSLLLPAVDRVTWCMTRTTSTFGSVARVRANAAFRREFRSDAAAVMRKK